MIFAAGIGSRLKPWTLAHPKALVEVGGEAMLGKVITKLKNAGVNSMVVNVHHFASQIEDYLRDNDNFGIDIRVSDERERLLDTGGGLLKAAHLLLSDDTPVILHNADILTDFPIEDMMLYHAKNGNDATLVVDKRSTSRYLLFDNEMQTTYHPPRSFFSMKGWMNMKTSEVRPHGTDIANLTPLAFGGVHILSTEMIKLVTEQYAEDEPFSIIDFYIANCHDRKIAGFTPMMPYKWHDIGKPESLKAARNEEYGI